VRPIAVFDTNILFSGLGWRGSAHQCLLLARKGLVESVTCQEILTELEAILRLKRKMSEDDIAKAIKEILLFSRLVRITNTLTGVVSDPDDHKVLECAVVGAQPISSRATDATCCRWAAIKASPLLVPPIS
jgi:putative PIN family toxin of toxin-antitoxin system